MFLSFRNVDARTLFKTTFSLPTKSWRKVRKKNKAHAVLPVAMMAAAGAAALCGVLSKTPYTGGTVSKKKFFVIAVVGPGDVPGHGADSKFEFPPTRRAPKGGCRLGSARRGPDRRGAPGVACDARGWIAGPGGSRHLAWSLARYTM